jgi:hypothetical protein
MATSKAIFSASGLRKSSGAGAGCGCVRAPAAQWGRRRRLGGHFRQLSLRLAALVAEQCIRWKLGAATAEIRHDDRRETYFSVAQRGPRKQLETAPAASVEVAWPARLSWSTWT